jgi:hypothetical protein
MYAMYKLMIIIPPHVNESILQTGWPEFLHAAESMPGLQREASVRVTDSLYGKQDINILHELFFENLTDLYEAMRSPEGLAAGQIIQQLTKGQMTLLIAEHREDDIENLRQYRQDE